MNDKRGRENCTPVQTTGLTTPATDDEIAEILDYAGYETNDNLYVLEYLNERGFTSEKWE